MNCPVCSVKLTKVRYEEVPIHFCSECRGSLVEKNRLKSIQNRRDKTESDFLGEIAAAGADSSEKLRCPRCKSTMEKKTKSLGSARFTIDRCRKCSLIWLDAGELAKMQLVYEYSEQGEESDRFRKRLNNMSPEEKQELEERIANLPEDRSFTISDDQWPVGPWFLNGLF